MVWFNIRNDRTGRELRVDGRGGFVLTRASTAKKTRQNFP